MIPVNILHMPFELMLFCSLALIGLAVVQQAGNRGRLIARRMLRAERRNTAASGYQQTGERGVTVAEDELLVPSPELTSPDRNIPFQARRLPVVIKQFDAATVTTIGSNSPLTAAPLSGDAVFAADDLSWRRESPFRPVDWRWRLAQRLFKEKLRGRPETRDPWVRRCAKFMRAECVRSQSCRPRRRASSDPILSDAARVRFATDPLVAAELDAWVLAASHPEFIAERCGLNVEVVAAYEAVFFDVRPYLDATGYIFHRVIGRPITHGFSLSDLGSLWKFCAYMRGPHALDVLLHVFPGVKPRPWPSSFPATPSEQRALIAVCRRMVWTRCLRLADMSPADVLRLLLLGRWYKNAQEAESGDPSGIGPVAEVDVMSLSEAQSDDLDSSSPVFVERGGSNESGGAGTSDGNKQAGAGSTDLELSGKLVEPAHRVRA